ncbi:MAG: excinuclease ABC subunit UvrC [Desulfomonilia bacterium]
MALNRAAIASLPRSTGVYILRDTAGKIIYIGKAKNIRSRVRSYLAQDSRIFTGHICSQTDKVDYVLTRNETEALLLENQMIKAHKPRYNIDLKDDKTYVRFKITLTHSWPGIYITRKVIHDGSRYFGPYSSAQATRKTLSAIGRIFPIRRCKDTEFENRSRPCMFHQIGLCMAPCVYKEIREEYTEILHDLISFLEGRNTDLQKSLAVRMKNESDLLNFEKAAKIRDQIEAIRNTLVPQAIVGDTLSDSDVFGTYRHRDMMQISVLSVYHGTLADSHNFTVRTVVEEDLMTNSILQFYLNRQEIPPVVYCDTLPESRAMLEEILSDMRGSSVKIRKGSRGKSLQWIVMAQENARNHAQGTDTSVLDEIARAFHLTSIPYRMECFDVSNLQGSYAAASRAVFIDAIPDKTLYRHYRIRSKDTPDDFTMLKEVIERRLHSDEAKPDLLVLDGGKGQLGMCIKVFNELGIPPLPVVAMAKAKGRKPDRFFLPGRKDAIALPERSAALKTLQRIRDEAHRFAIRYHRNLRSKASGSILEEIPGIGPRKTAVILKALARIEDLSALSEQDLSTIPGLTKADRKALLEHLIGTMKKSPHTTPNDHFSGASE